MRFQSWHTCKVIASADGLTIGYVDNYPSIWNGNMHVLQPGEEYREPLPEFSNYKLENSKWVKTQKARKTKKRSSGEGTAIVKRKDGRWWTKITVNGERIPVYGKTEGECKEKRNAIQEEVRKGIYIKPTKQTFGEWLELWLKEYAKPTIRPTTYDSYEYLCRVHIIPGLGKIILKELQPSQIQKFYNAKLHEKRESRRKKESKIKTTEELKPLSPSTIRHMHIIISESLEQAIKENKIIRNPASATKPPKTAKKEARYLTPEQLKEFLGKISDDYWYPAFVVALNTGVRLGELCALKWSCVDLQKGILYIKEAVSWVKEGETRKRNFHAPKSQKGLRNIPLPPMAIEELKRLKKRQEEFHGGVVQIKKKDSFIFTWPDDRLVDNCYLSKHFAKLIKKHSLSMNFHGLRHSYATALLQAGEHPKVVQELLGDSTITVVLDTYSHVTPGLKEKAAGKLDGLFSNDTSLVSEKK